MLFGDEENWGPRPLRMLKCWADFPGYADFVRSRWGSFVLNGWGSYVLKEKLKLIKGSLKEWHQTHSQNLDGKLRVVKDRMATLDCKGESSDLLHDELKELHELSVNLHSLSRVQSSMCWQKARLTWLQEGDANSKKKTMVLCLPNVAAMLFSWFKLMVFRFRGFKISERLFFHISPPILKLRKLRGRGWTICLFVGSQLWILRI